MNGKEISDNRLIDVSVKSVSKIVNMIPGTPIYKGTRREKFSLEKYVFDNESFTQENYDTCNEKFINSVNSIEKNKVQWINVTGINHIEEIQNIGRVFGIDSMILEQILNVSKYSSFGNTDEYIFNDIQMIYLKNDVFTSENVSIYYHNNIILTFQERQGDVFESIRDRIVNDNGHLRRKSSEYTYFCLLDAVIDHYIYVLENIKTKIEKMEIEIIDAKNMEYQELHPLRKQIMTISLNARMIGKIIEDVLSNNQERFIKQKKYFESLSKHIDLILNEITIQKVIVDGLYENYMISKAYEMNQVITILTIFSAIFIPLSFLAGVFGMNFETVPGLNNPDSFSNFLLLCGCTAIGMLTFFKVKKWF